MAYPIIFVYFQCLALGWLKKHIRTRKGEVYLDVGNLRCIDRRFSFSEVFPHGFSALFRLGVSHGNSSRLRRTPRGLQAETQRLFRWTDLGRSVADLTSLSVTGMMAIYGNIWELDSGNHQGLNWLNSYVMLFSGH